MRRVQVGEVLPEAEASPFLKHAVARGRRSSGTAFNAGRTASTPLSGADRQQALNFLRHFFWPPIDRRFFSLLQQHVGGLKNALRMARIFGPYRDNRKMQAGAEIPWIARVLRMFKVFEAELPRQFLNGLGDLLESGRSAEGRSR